MDASAAIDWQRFFSLELPRVDRQEGRREADEPRIRDPFAQFPTRRYWLKRMPYRLRWLDS